MRLSLFKFIPLFVGAAGLFSACAGRKPLDHFVDQQKQRVQEQSVYVEAEFDFWAAYYEPTSEDLQALRSAWVEHGQAFPESKAMTAIEEAVRNAREKTILVSLFMTEYAQANLRDKSLGWSTHPVPDKVTELSQDDLVLRTLMPVKNLWARFFLLRYALASWSDPDEFVVSNRNSKLRFKLK